MGKWYHLFMNIGFLGCSKIGVKIIEALKANPDVTLYGCAARDEAKAIEYKNKHGFLHLYKSYKDLVSDPNIDLVYISTLISSHYEDTKLALEHGKNCLVEKAFTVNSKEAEELIRISNNKNLFLGEAIWTRYMPSRKMINEILASGIIGDIYMLSANLSYKIDDQERLIKKSMGGGILLDVGVYPINFAFMVLGSDYQSFKSSLIYKNHGVEETCVINLFYKNGIVANLYSSMNGNSDRSGYIYGTNGYLRVDNINNPSEIEIYTPNTPGEKDMILQNKIHIREDVNGYEYQFYEAILAIKSNVNEPISMPHAETLKVMKLIDKIKSSSFIVNN